MLGWINVMTRIKLLFFFPVKRKIVIKTTICFFSSKPKPCFCPLVPALNQKQLHCECVSVALKDMLTPDPKPGRFLLTRELLALFCEINTSVVHEPAPHRVPIWSHPPHISQMLYGHSYLPRLRSCSHIKESTQHVNKNL